MALTTAGGAASTAMTPSIVHSEKTDPRNQRSLILTIIGRVSKMYDCLLVWRKVKARKATPFLFSASSKFVLMSDLHCGVENGNELAHHRGKISQRQVRG